VIVRSEGQQLLLVRQTDHQFLAGRLAEAWGAAPFPRLSDGAIRAAYGHDEGWRLWEEKPRIDPRAHRPYQFTDLPVLEHLSFYREGVRAAVDKDLYAGLLVNMHCVGLYNGRYGKIEGLPPRQRSAEEQAVIQRFTRELEQEQAGLREQLQLAADAPSLWRDYTLLQICDLLSLYLCGGAAQERALKQVPTASAGAFAEVHFQPLGEGHIAVNPYPFRPEPTYANVTAYLVPDRAYGSDREFQKVYSRAPEQVLSFELVPAGQTGD
jgi:hypothetical protein